MFSAKVVVIIGGLFTVPFTSLAIYESSADSYSAMQNILSKLDEEVIDNIGIQDMECFFVPFPSKRPERISTYAR